MSDALNDLETCPEIRRPETRIGEVWLGGQAPLNGLLGGNLEHTVTPSVVGGLKPLSSVSRSWWLLIAIPGPHAALSH
ncbi:hypothetical protein HPT29_025600 (plasmid) [Microvirga terrae]|uniref:Uncharacterized protein n=1 Tax=Microvirga terrae TaxID=2740529 RepID=A0ABY5RZ51_9HYPH|nr:hypothetical protein [Microvirga terrae]UVF22526.1 hypothetical protein HPT29_025600 [Microvirga terrae]